MNAMIFFLGELIESKKTQIIVHQKIIPNHSSDKKKPIQINEPAFKFYQEIA